MLYDVRHRLCDGGCIFTLGYQPGAIVRGYHLYGVHRSPLAQSAPHNGIFLDKSSRGCPFLQNAIYDTHAAAIRFNEC
ncbi:MAG: hypothetical protein OES79_04460 [Planctomycetota bacterium]|nr:hypothetical protein [Planctomycetota bacterium]